MRASVTTRRWRHFCHAHPWREVPLRQKSVVCKDRWIIYAFMDLEKAYDRADRKRWWDVVRIYDVGGCLLEGI